MLSSESAEVLPAENPFRGFPEILGLPILSVQTRDICHSIDLVELRRMVLLSLLAYALERIGRCFTKCVGMLRYFPMGKKWNFSFFGGAVEARADLSTPLDRARRALSGLMDIIFGLFT